ncbi:MAG: response regulator [Bacteroidetes bacterium]|nr:response regulator [Bacteroidota bacterium]
MKKQATEVFVPSVLFIVESVELRHYLRELFLREKYHLRFYSRLDFAIDTIKKNPIDLLVVVPENDIEVYIRFLKKLADERPEIRVVMITSKDREPKVLEAVATGIVHKLLIKPFSDELVRGVVSELVYLNYKLRFEAMRKKLASFRSLPSPTRFQERIHHLLHEQDRNLREIVAEIEQNPALVAKVLQVANSVHFWTRVPITTVWDAVVFIGTENVAAIIAAIEVFNTLGQNVPDDVKAYYELLWNRSLLRANIAKHIAEEWEEVNNSQVVYVTALLQDIGLLIRLVNEPIRYREMMHRSHTQHITLAEAELQVFTHFHADIGAFVLQLWNFPKDIVFAVAHHHGFTYDDPLTQTIQMADILATSDTTIPHDPTIDPFLDIWTVRLGGFFHPLTTPPLYKQ